MDSRRTQQVLGPFEVQKRARKFWGRVGHVVLSHRRDEFAIDPYAWDQEGGIWLTPIEEALWSDIRLCDLVMYPQWPVLGYFADFANPVARLVVECDGERFHSLERDVPRQLAMQKAGWTVYRFPGWACVKQPTVEVEDEFGRAKRMESETVHRLRLIGERHGIKRLDSVAPTESPRESFIDQLLGN